MAKGSKPNGGSKKEGEGKTPKTDGPKQQSGKKVKVKGHRRSGPVDRPKEVGGGPINT